MTIQDAVSIFSEIDSAANSIDPRGKARRCGVVDHPWGLLCEGPSFSAAAAFARDAANADEGGISFWLPGTFGSLAAAPTTPGLSWVDIYIHPNGPFLRGSPNQSSEAC